MGQVSRASTSPEMAGCKSCGNRSGLDALERGRGDAAEAARQGGYGGGGPAGNERGFLGLSEKQELRVHESHAGAARCHLSRVPAMAEATQRRRALSQFAKDLPIAISADRRRIA